MANEAKMVFGSETTVISLAAALASGANTYSFLSGCKMTELHNSTALYPDAIAILSITDTFAAAPTAGGTIDLYMTLDDISGTSDETPAPASSDITYLAKYCGSWAIDNQDVAQLKPLMISLKGAKKAQFYIANNSGQQISYTSTATTVKITPFTIGPT